VTLQRPVFLDSTLPLFFQAPNCITVLNDGTLISIGYDHLEMLAGGRGGC
jgi:hypothetical protein